MLCIVREIPKKYYKDLALHYYNIVIDFTMNLF